MPGTRSPVALDRNIADVMQRAVESTLQNMFNIPVSCGSHTVGKTSTGDDSDAASKLDMIDQNEVRGVFMVTFSNEAIRKILSSCDLGNADDPAIVQDAMNEIANVIYGEVKSSLNDLGHRFVLDLPKSITDKSAFFQDYRDSEWLVLPFFADGCRCHAMIITKNMSEITP